MSKIEIIESTTIQRTKIKSVTGIEYVRIAYYDKYRNISNVKWKFFTKCNSLSEPSGDFKEYLETLYQEINSKEKVLKK